MAEIDKFFRALAKHEGSDIHVNYGCVPTLRINGSMQPLKLGPMPAKQVQMILEEITPERFREQFALTGDADFSY